MRRKFLLAFTLILAFLAGVGSLHASAIAITESGVGSFNTLYLFTVSPATVGISGGLGVTNISDASWVATNVNTHETTAVGNTVTSLTYTADFTGNSATVDQFYFNGGSFVDGVQFKTNSDGTLIANSITKLGPNDFTTVSGVPEIGTMGMMLTAIVFCCVTLHLRRYRQQLT